MRRQTSLLGLSLLAGLPGVVVAIALLWSADLSRSLRTVLALVLVTTWLGLSLLANSRSRYRLRTQPNLNSLCTLEAIARAVGILESPSAQMQLETVLSVKVARTMQARGVRLPLP